jgi:simple sugar transport system ATP-binding protein
LTDRCLHATILSTLFFALRGSEASMVEVFLEVRNISKAYEGVQALKDVSLAIGRGEVHCLVGENGSGKSTLIKIIGGVVAPDRGVVVIGGRTHTHLAAIDAIRQGIQIIYQDLSLYPNLSVAENISFNQFVERRSSFVSWRDMRAIARHGLAEIGESIDLEQSVQELSVAQRQIVAIARSLTQKARLIIMDEPTSAISREDVKHLFSVIDRLKSKGISTLFISHKLNEIFEIAEVVTILRDGRKVGDFPAAELDDAKLTYLMTGQRIEYTPYRAPAERAAPLLEVRGLTRRGQFQEVSFSLWPGEILGLTGLLGSGRTELALALFGLNPPAAGRILLNGKEVRIRSPKDAGRLGISYLPEDRLTQGLFIGQSIGDNIVITVLKKLLGWLGLIDPSRKRKTERRWLEELAIKAPSARVRAWSLSGGNQQRVVLAKWLATDPKIFILDGPTIGIDIASKRNIHEIIRALAERGIAILMISDEIPEILHNCNRVLVMRDGRLEREIQDVGQVSEAELLAAVGGKLSNGAA